MSSPESLADVFEEDLKDLYSAENQLLKALPKMAKKASNPALKDAFTAHAKETQGQIARLEKIGKSLGIKLSGKVCKAMKGLIEEGKEVLEEDSDNPALIDIMLVTAAQKCEHYEISGYGTLSVIAEKLGYSKEASLLKETEEEEGETDKKLTEITSQLLTDADADSSDDVDDDEQEAPRKKTSKTKSKR